MNNLDFLPSLPREKYLENCLAGKVKEIYGLLRDFEDKKETLNLLQLNEIMHDLKSNVRDLKLNEQNAEYCLITGRFSPDYKEIVRLSVSGMQSVKKVIELRKSNLFELIHPDLGLGYFD